MVASALRYEPNVLMYELINEPCPGFMTSPYWWMSLRWWLDTDHVEQTVFVPFYQHVMAAIRVVDDRHVMAVQPWLSTFLKPFTAPLGGMEARDREALSWHLYCPWAPDKNPRLAWMCGWINAASFAIVRHNLKVQGVGGILSEFGSLGNTSAELAELQDVVKLADEHFSSRAYWQYKSYRDITSSGGLGLLTFYSDGDLQADKVRALATPYAQIVAGLPRFMLFDASSATFVLEFAPMRNESGAERGAETALHRTSVVHLSTPLHYPNGFRVMTNAANNDFVLRLSDESVLEIEHASASTSRTLVLCVVPCTTASSCTGPLALDRFALQWRHPCGIRLVGLRWYATLILSTLLLLQLACLDVILQRKHALERCAESSVGWLLVHSEEDTSRGTSQNIVQTLFAAPFHSNLITLASGAATISSLWCTGRPLRNDHQWHHVLWLSLLIILQCCVSVVSGKASPMLSVAIVLFFEVRSFTHWMLDHFMGGASIEALIAIHVVLLLPIGIALLKLTRFPQHRDVASIRRALVCHGLHAASRGGNEAELADRAHRWLS
eukprot:TRINITY_DN34097_c0_g1_i1.p1 TRINITY_DN34097_c0_g1~~TRINITY_DN34097_c0_g1_i1.p1  ORF type:complete len:554 (-),score=65.70 TRINITY_DN34097_c0_g1_i1:8-1669(-)